MIAMIIKPPKSSSVWRWTMVMITMTIKRSWSSSVWPWWSQWPSDRRCTSHFPIPKGPTLVLANTGSNPRKYFVKMWNTKMFLNISIISSWAESQSFELCSLSPFKLNQTLLNFLSTQIMSSWIQRPASIAVGKLKQRRRLNSKHCLQFTLKFWNGKAVQLNQIRLHSTFCSCA